MANNKKKEDNVVEKAKEDAKQRVADLTSGILPPVQQPIKKEEPIINKISMEDEKNIEYLKEQLDVLVERNNELECENIKIKDDYQKLYQKYKDISEGTTSVSEFGENMLEKKIIDLYTDIRDAYTGNSPRYSEKYEQIPIRSFLPRLENMFPFVRNFR